MGTLQRASPAAGGSGGSYRITPAGRVACAPGHAQVNSRYLLDLLDLLQSNGRGMRQWELGQFMPPASLEESILALLQRGLIECERDEPPSRALQLHYPPTITSLCGAKTSC